ncbi:amino acid racemase [Undibacterium sp. TS12]|uniref:aspartate/glutamate racemase family protein n=1 Tax=Undibacterium sp. TS12 TaxID=2908202 RepID=UPI001F4CF508|nr:amino acid racemase [Undibacterium sp. TS12]MCH8621183.1 aspartate/glutamate racemase family protein [Undibacterium sp. TS12]
MTGNAGKKNLGIVGGLGAIGGADIFFKIAESVSKEGKSDQFNIVLEQHPFNEGPTPGAENALCNARKLYIFDMIRRFEKSQVESVLLPCFISHTFIDELKSEVSLPILDIMQALRLHLERNYPTAGKLGVLTSDYVKKNALFERYFKPPAYALIYPGQAVQENCVMQAIYGERGIKAGHIRGEAVELMHQACLDLLNQGAEVIVPGTTEVSIVTEVLRERGIPILDANRIYAQYATVAQGQASEKAYKIGIVGGVGPAATVDFMNKIVRHTAAERDQDHIKIVVEHNPNIPDRTASLTGNGTDPTIALYSACKKLEESDASIIAIPCNTAHAFVERIQSHLQIPIVNMLNETVDYIVRHYSDRTTIGLLATSGTISSRVYHEAVAGTAFQMITPEPACQQKVMDAIYGEHGVKSSGVTEQAYQNLLCALEHLVARGAEVIILGCTELPLLLEQTEHFAVQGKEVAVLDPTTILAKKCVQLSGRARPEA